MKDGIIAERGAHQELINRGGDYFQMQQFDQVRDQKSANAADSEEVAGGEDDEGKVNFILP